MTTGDLQAELVNEKSRADSLDKEARTMRFGLFEIEERATFLRMEGVARMAKEIRLDSCKRGGKAVDDAILILRKVASGPDEDLSQKALDTLKALGCGEPS